MVNVGVVGLGWWGMRVIDVLADSSLITVVAATDPVGEARTVAAERGISTYDTCEALLEDPNVEAVILTSPHQAHAEQVVAAAGSGRHVFCEKPFTTHTADAVRALDAVVAANVVVGIGHERRFEPAIRELTSLVAAGALGTPMVFEGAFSQDKFLALPSDNWRLSPVLAQVGPLSATGIHLMDLALSLLGRPRQVTALLDTRLPHFPNGDALSVQIGFESGASALLSAVLCTPFDGRVALYGSEGWMEIRDRTHPENPTGWDVTIRRRGHEVVTRFDPPHPIVKANLEAWATAITGGAPYPVTPDDILTNVMTFEAITTSALGGKTVTIE
jgi:hypothetical protein